METYNQSFTACNFEFVQFQNFSSSRVQIEKYPMRYNKMHVPVFSVTFHILKHNYTQQVS